jgi:3-hydroxyisobutyrate dehydrogenase
MTAGAIAAPSSVGFLGLGKMGAPMAANLVAAGWSVRAYDVSGAALDAFVAACPRATRAQSPAGAAAGDEVLITMLPDGKAVRAALLDGGAAAALPKGALVVDMSSSAPLGTRALGDELARIGVRLVDAPVSGGVKRAREAKLAIMAGGDPDAVRWCRPLLASMGSSVHETGPLGSGHAMKALNNFVSAAGLVATCEALVVGRRFGLDPALMVDVLNASSGRNNTTEVKAKQYMLSGTFGSGFSLALMAKDLRTAAELADELGIPAPLARAMAERWTAAQDLLEPGADHTAMFRAVEAAASKGR